MIFTRSRASGVSVANRPSTLARWIIAPEQESRFAAFVWPPTRITATSTHDHGRLLRLCIFGMAAGYG